mgnify:CR=1 FL=1
MGHCQGGAATDSWDGLGALMDWVEKGQAPQRIVATGTAVFPGAHKAAVPLPGLRALQRRQRRRTPRAFGCRAP